MDVIQTANKQVDKFGAGLHGFQAGVPGVSLATALSPAWCDAVMMELLNTILDAGVAKDGAVLTQMRQALRRLYGGNGSTLVNGTTVLTADSSGVVFVDATAGAVNITMPATDAVNGRPYPLRFIRIDTSANAVTISRAGSNNIFNFASTTSISLRAGEQLQMWSNGLAAGAGLWHVLNGAYARSLANSGWQRLPSGLLLQWGQVSWSGESAVVSFPIAFPNACRSVVGNAMFDNGSVSVQSWTATNFNASALDSNTNTVGSHNFSFIAIGD